MRPSNKSRNRNKSNNNRRGSAGNNINRVFDSSGPQGRVRGTPQQIIDKYLSLTYDSQLSGDRVAAENFQQHAEHYCRLLIEAQKELAEKQVETNYNTNTVNISNTTSPTLNKSSTTLSSDDNSEQKKQSNETEVTINSDKVVEFGKNVDKKNSEPDVLVEQIKKQDKVKTARKVVKKQTSVDNKKAVEVIEII